VTATTPNEPLPPPPPPPSSSSAASPAAGGGILQIMPALGTHLPMSQIQITKMFGMELASLSPSPFIIHDWRNDVITIGHVPSYMVSSATYGLVKDTEWPAQLNKLVWEKRISNYHNNNNSSLSSDTNNDTTDTSSTTSTTSHPPLILSVGQVVPHEVLGMANYNKNLFVGVGGVEAINLSHFIGAVHGMEKLMGRGHNPLRSILNYASERYIENKFDLWYILTVMGVDYSNATTANPGGEVVMRGLYIGNTVECYDKACELSLQVNFNLLSHPPKRMVVYLNEEYQSTWLGNKAIYRTRMAIADGGELIIIAPHVEMFGEDKQIDVLIRQVGYTGTPAIMNTMAKDDSSSMKDNLSAMAHLIHGSSEGRFTIVYCPGKLSQSEIESVGFKYGKLQDMMQRYDITTLKDGWNTEINADDGTVEEYYYISNPALGLWAVSSRFEEEDAAVSSNKLDEEDGDCSSSTTNIISDNQQAVDMSGGVGGWKKPPPSN
jgi:nickel-dependent lactate racemase